MKTFKKISLAVCASALLLPSLSQAQGTYQGVGPKEGDREFSIGGVGKSNKNFDNGSFGLSGDMGWYLNDRTVAGVRQSASWAAVNNGDDAWQGATKGFIDYHFGTEKLRPFVGATLGAIYGDGVKETGTAGLELGMKYYVLPTTFVQARAEYSFLFDSSNSAGDNYDNGSWDYVVGMGYNF
ncbi:hypothetical protein [Oceanisphaera ostreae]|uniref:Outer membrane protein beta-barrel domain-containing protein n=1 Tax=Oceanisphaera ostreae TaxID=914151 RepID=A0ABW3KL82_9GAMM